MAINMQIEFPKLQEEIIKLKRLLHDLTPGGSEFYDDPEYCAKWVKESRLEHHYALAGQIKRLKEDNIALREQNRVLIEALKDLAYVVGFHYEGKPALIKAKELLKNITGQ